MRPTLAQPQTAQRVDAWGYDEKPRLPHFPQSWNRYAYVDNTPLSATDPTGLFAVVPPGCVGTPNADPETGDYYMCPDDGGLLAFQQAWVNESGGGGGGGGGGNVTTVKPSGPANTAPLGPDLRDLLQCAVDRTDGLGPQGTLGKLLLGNSVAEFVGLALRATAPSADVGQAFAQAGGVGVTDAALEPAINPAGEALVQGIAALQESGQITQLGLETAIEQSAPEILRFAGADFAGPVGWAKFAWDAGQFAYEAYQCHQ